MTSEQRYIVVYGVPSFRVGKTIAEDDLKLPVEYTTPYRIIESQKRRLASVMKLVVAQKPTQPTLRIYTDGGDGSSTEHKMAEELMKVRKELGATKVALKLQVARCRQLVAAFTRKLQEKEVELRASNQLRDQQLSCVLRSLLILEGRLRKEQKLIRVQLSEKDAVIAKQEEELNQLRCIGDPPAPQLLIGEERLDSLCRPLEDFTYKDNPVLESVHQILLKDEEDLLNEVKSIDKGDKCSKVIGGVEWYETDSSLILPDEQQPSGAWCIKIEEGDDLDPPRSSERLWVKERTSPPTKAQHLEEKACLQMSKKTLTIALPKELEEVDRDIAVSECSYQELAPVTSKPVYQKIILPQKPPALPPKPSRLLKPSELLHRVEGTNAKPEMLPKPRVHVQEIKRKQMNGHVPGNIKPQAQFVVGTRVDPSLPLPATRVKALPEKEVNSEVARPMNSIRTAVRHDLSDDALRMTRHDVGEPSIRMGSSVSSLITGAARDSIVTELTTSAESGFSQTPRQSDGEISKLTEDPLQDNFEEFRLDESYVECASESDGRPEADGAEARCGVSHYAVLGPPTAPITIPDTSQVYETFLETTGLSQKSILTPSRMLSNHRSCLKPKDVKLRSRVKAAAIEKCTASSLGPTVKYWTEPYL